MKYIPILIQEYIECEQALKEAEWHSSGDGLDYTESFNYAALSRLEKILSADSDAMTMIKMHGEYGQRLPVVLERIAKLRKDSHGFWPSEPVSADKPLIVPARDAELVEGNWEKCNSGLREKDLEIVTIRQLAELRMRHGKGSEYCVNGSWVGEGIVYMPNGKVIILPRGNNLLIKNPTTVLNAHKNGNEFYIYDYAQIESNPDFLILERGNIPSEISVGSFNDNLITRYLFKDLAGDYGNFLKKCGIDAINLFTCDEKYAKKQEQPFVHALCAGDLIVNSALFGNLNLYLHYGRAFGVSRRGEQPPAASSGERSETGSTGPR